MAQHESERCKFDRELVNSDWIYNKMANSTAIIIHPLAPKNGKRYLYIDLRVNNPQVVNVARQRVKWWAAAILCGTLSAHCMCERTRQLLLINRKGWNTTYHWPHNACHSNSNSFSKRIHKHQPPYRMALLLLLFIYYTPCTAIDDKDTAWKWEQIGFN